MAALGRSSEQQRKLSLDLRVPVLAREVSGVRRAFEGLRVPAPLLDDIQLLVTELVTNSIRHAGLEADETIRVRAEVSGTRLRVDVIDRAGPGRRQGLAGAIRPLPGAESGWGLYLLDRLATRWGWGRDRYWFELDLDRSDESRNT